jgi:hypothetical protein
MRSPLVLPILLMLAACDGDGDGDNNDERPVVVESQSLAVGEFDSCDVVGQVLNTDGDVTCDVFISFNARDSAGIIIADGIGSVFGLPPNSRARYVAPLITPGDDFIPCRQIASFELSELDQFCD